MTRDERLKIARAEREAEYLQEQEDCGIAYISFASIEEVKQRMAEIHNQPIEIIE